MAKGEWRCFVKPDAGIGIAGKLKCIWLAEAAASGKIQKRHVRDPDFQDFLNMPLFNNYNICKERIDKSTLSAFEAYHRKPITEKISHRLSEIMSGFAIISRTLFL